MSEATLQTELKALFDATDTFDASSVLINETNILDKSKQNAPFLFILSADDFASNFRTGGVDIDYSAYIIVITAYNTGRPEKESRDDFTTTRDVVISTLQDNDLTTGRIIDFRSLTGIDPITYDNDPNAIPQYLAQIIEITMRDDG